MKYFNIQDFKVLNKKVLVRVDYNVPIDENGRILDNKRIKDSLPTIKYLLKNKAKIILASHLGRPQGQVVNELKLDKVAKELKRLLKRNVYKLNECLGKKVKEFIAKLKVGDIVLLENLRFHMEEEKNDSGFAKELASLAEFYVNDAFGASHRAHASVEAITNFLPSAAGFLLQEEIKQLTKVLKPKKPAIWILGGAKVSDKLGTIKNLINKFDKILVGGALAFNLLKLRDFNIETKLENIRLNRKILLNKTQEIALQFLCPERQGISVSRKFKEFSRKLILPIDAVIADKFDPKAKTKIVEVNKIPGEWLALDIGPKSIALFKKNLKLAKTILFTGPLGVFEFAKFSKGTKEMAKQIAKAKAIKIAGGGDTAEALARFKVEKKFTWVSTGGGASIEFLSGKKLPAIKALERSHNIFRYRLNAK